MRIYAATSPADILDRLSILDIKADRLTDPAKLEHVRHERAELSKAWQMTAKDFARINGRYTRLKAVNTELWMLEDAMRAALSNAATYAADIAAIARNIQKQNDERARLKREVNEAMGSSIREQKSYEGEV